MRETDRRGWRRYPEREVYTLSDLEQIKVLADPLRLRLLESFCEERTTKQAADLLGEKPTRLYHHVDALERVGLIELSRTRRNRGTLEKYYLAVARTFRADSELFSAGDRRNEEQASAVRAMVSSAFDTTLAELGRLIERDHGTSALESEGILTYCEIHASEGALREVRRQLTEALELVQRVAHEADGDERQGDAEEGGSDAEERESPSEAASGEAADAAEAAGEAEGDTEEDARQEGERGPRRRYRLMLAYFPLLDDRR